MDDLFLFVLKHVHNEVHPRCPGGVDHIFVDGIALENPCFCQGMSDGSGGVVGVYRLPGGYPRKNALASPGEARKEVGFDEALADQKIRLHRQAVDTAGAPRGELSQRYHLVGAFHVMHHDLFLFRHLFTEALKNLLPGGFPMQPRGDENGYIRLGIPRTDFLEKNG